MRLYQVRDAGNYGLIGLGALACVAWCVYGLTTLNSSEPQLFAVFALAVLSLLAGGLAAALHNLAWRIGLWIAGRDSYLCLPVERS